jgi:type IV pilus assembly protein PilV
MTRAPSHQQGVMLIEALIGLLIFSIGILAMLGMQGLAMRATIDAKYRSEASFLANEVIGEMWVDRSNLASYATDPSSPLSCPSAPPMSTPCTWLSRVSTTLPQGTGTTTAPTVAVAGQQVTVTVRWQRPGESTVSNHVVVANIVGS